MKKVVLFSNCTYDNLFCFVLKYLSQMFSAFVNTPMKTFTKVVHNSTYHFMFNGSNSVSMPFR